MVLIKFQKAFILLACFQIINSKMLKLPDCSKYNSMFKVAFEDKRLQRKWQIRKIDNVLLPQCLQICTVDPLCLSVDYKKEENECRLLSIEYNPTLHDQEIDEGFNHYETKERKHMGDVCEKHMEYCPGANERCQDKCEHPYYECVPRGDDITSYKANISQSNTFEEFIAFRAVDGDKNTNFYSLSCMHTNGPPDWWRITYNHEVLIYSVQIYNRMDCCSERLSYSKVIIFQQVSDDPNVLEGTVSCGDTGNMKDISEQTMVCDKPARGYGVEIRNIINVLHICEVYIRGEFVY